MKIKEELERRKKATGKTLLERQKEESIKAWCDSLEDGTAVIVLFTFIGVIVAVVVMIALLANLM